MIRNALLLAATLALAPMTSIGAQVRLPVTQPPIRQLTPPTKTVGDSQPIPKDYRPPPGMCRIWLDGVPANQQPAPTDCVTAVRNRPHNGRVIFGDDYVDRKSKDKRPESRVDAGRIAEPLDAFVGPGRPVIVGATGRIHGPNAGDEVETLDARQVDLPGVAAFASFEQPRRPMSRRDSLRADSIRRESLRRTIPPRVERDSSLSERRRALRDRGRDARRDDVDDDDDEDLRDDRRGVQGVAPRGYYPPYAPPARANGVCLDRDGDGWCDDVRAGSPYCVDRDGDGRCDDYGDLASAPYSSSMPPMSAASDVKRGFGSQAALRWLGTAEVIVRTTDLKRTGTPYRAMWLDANSGRVLQVWTDRDGDGIADRVEIYRNGRVAKILGR